MVNRVGRARPSSPAAGTAAHDEDGRLRPRLPTRQNRTPMDGPGFGRGVTSKTDRAPAPHKRAREGGGGRGGREEEEKNRKRGRWHRVHSLHGRPLSRSKFFQLDPKRIVLFGDLQRRSRHYTPHTPHPTLCTLPGCRCFCVLVGRRRALPFPPSVCLFLGGFCGPRLESLCTLFLHWYAFPPLLPPLPPFLSFYNPLFNTSFTAVPPQARPAASSPAPTAAG